jgi:lipoprotein-anchoring transpeptidase ErfK/SrfK
MNRSTDQLIKEGHLAIRRGEKAEARRLLEQAAQQNPDDYRVWLGLAAVSKTPQASIAMIDKAAALKPDNAAVLQARKWAEGRLKSAKPASEALPAPMPVRQLPLPNKKQPPIVMTEPVEKSAVSRNLLLRRIVGWAAIFGLILALGILTWYSWTTWQDDGSLAEIPPTAEVAQLSEVEVSSILPEQSAVVPALENATATPNPIQPKNIIQEAGESRPRWTVTPLPTLTPTPSPTWVPTFVSPLSETGLLKPIGLFPNERWIDVDISTQSLVAFDGDTPVFETLISSGLAQHPTVLGQFRVWLRYESQTMDGSRLGYDYYLENVKYVQYFYEDYALHGTYWHNNFGTPMSHGCVNLSNADSEFLYNFADYGTVVNVHE